jgi:hypothetical protein
LEPPYLIPGLGWHELKIPYSASRQQAIADAKKEYPQGAPPGGDLKGALGHDVVQGAGLAPLTSIGDFFHRLTESQTWIRVAEVIGGGLVLFIGVRALTSQTAVSTATKSVTRPAKKVVRAGASVAVPEYKAARRVSHARKIAVERAKPSAPRTSHIYHHRAPVKPKTVSLAKKAKKATP